jgi:hypothetical protein
LFIRPASFTDKEEKETKKEKENTPTKSNKYVTPTLKLPTGRDFV